jgi:hypothetical protein
MGLMSWEDAMMEAVSTLASQADELVKRLTRSVLTGCTQIVLDPGESRRWLEQYGRKPKMPSLPDSGNDLPPAPKSVP